MAALLSITPIVASARLEIEFPEAGLHFVALAGETAGVKWKAERIVLRGALAQEESTTGGALEIAAIDLSLSDESRALVAQAIDVEGKIEIDELTVGRARGRVELVLAAGEVLLDTFYADLTHYPLSLAADFDVTLGAGGAIAKVAFADGKLAAKGLGTVRAGGEVSLEPLRATVDAIFEIDGLARLYQLTVVEPLGGSQPWIAGTALTGTLLGEVAYRLQASGDYRLDGEARLRDGYFSGPDPGWQVGGMHVDLPFILDTAAAAAGSRKGVIETAGAVVQGVEMKGVSLPLVASRNAVALARPSAIELLDGRVHLRKASAEHLIEPSRSVTVSIDLDGLDLARFAEEIGLPPLRGTLTGSIPEISIADGELTSRGEIVADVFGGRVRARNLHGDGLGSAVPSFGLDADFEDISLGELTPVLSFGYVSGIARGAVSGLEMVSSGPVAFDAWLESVPKRGVSQRLSVDAIRQISIVGGGTSDPLSQGVMSFFDEYRYSKLGFQCSLRNDEFVIDGVEKEGDRHYVVVAATVPPRVEVVIYNRRIAFSDMIGRLESALQ